MIAGAVARGASFDALAAARTLAGDVDRYATLRVVPVVETTALSILGLLRASHVRDDGGPDADGGLWVIGDANHVSGAQVDAVRRRIDPASPMGADIKGRQFALRVAADKRSVELWTDPLGTLTLFVGETPDAVRFCTDFGALARSMAGRLTFDPEVGFRELALGGFADDRTVFREIRVAAPGAIVRIDRDGANVVAQRTVTFGDAHLGKDDEQKFAVLDEIFDDVVHEHLEPMSESLLLSLSTGFDSRYGLALAQRAGLEFDCLTFGAPESLEVFGARRVAASAGLATDVFEIPDGRWDSWRDLVQLIGNCGTVQWCGWSDAWGRHLARRGRNVMIGYLGDATSGVRLNFDPGSSDWLRDWLLALARWDLSKADAAPSFVDGRWGGRGLESLVAAARSELSRQSLPLAHHGAQFLSLYGRQRRHVPSQPNQLAHFVTPVAYLYDWRLLDFCANLPLEDLAGQRLYLAYARSRFPDLFPRAGGQISFGAGERIARKAASIVDWLLGRAGEAARPPVIDRNRIILPNKDAILALASRTADVAAPVVDAERFRDAVQAYDGTDREQSGPLIMTTNLLHLLDLSVR